MSRCGECKEKMFGGDGAQCSSCKLIYHFNCIGITEGYRKLGDRKTTWRCPKCKTGGQQPGTTTLSPLPEATLREEVKSLTARMSAFEELVNEEFGSRLLNIENSKEAIKTLENRVGLLEKDRDFAEQWHRMSYVEVKGIPQSVNENLIDLVISIGSKVNYLITKRQVNFVARTPSRDSNCPKSIIASFNNTYVTEDFVAALRTFNKDGLLTPNISGVKPQLTSEQHGFLRNRSTVSNLIIANEYISSGMDRRAQVGVVYTDYSKCFDRIDHDILLNKLTSMGIHGDLSRWFKSYVDNRSQAVALQGYTSNWMSITSGVPHGSLLGPLLFILLLLYVNDILSCFKYSKILLYADDMKIMKLISTRQDTLELQEDLNRFEDYCLRNKLDLNVSKCFCMTFTKKSNKINTKHELKNSASEAVDVD
ncbi:unnamed protein product [Pieris macdunnoughi]|uniref:Reverse transcriptase domain-containing protein n=1 Tax=Pieris macdunnoughi TaxID=345717 RepID=A0A821KMP4_9NEOP|nr:unnamed protein product [Pieris macdunnoughi]